MKPPGTSGVSSIQDLIDDCNTLSDEILLIIDDDPPEEGVSINVVVTNLETSQEIVDTDVNADTNTRGGSTECDWTADTEPPVTGTPSPDDVLPPNVLYKLEFTVTGGAHPGTYTYTYFNCYSTGYDTVDEGFYCPNGDGSQEDLYFVYDGATDKLKVFPEVYDTDDGFYDDAFSDNYWMVPYNGDVYCGSCSSSTKQISFFLARQLGPTFRLTSADLVVPSDRSWSWGDNITVEFASGKKLNVYGTLEADDVTFSASGSSWSGIYFYSGSTGDITNSVIEEVSAGAAVYANTVSSVTIEESDIENTHSNPYSMAVWAFGNNGTLTLYDNRIAADEGPTVLVQGSVSSYFYNNDIVMDGSTDGTVYIENFADADFAQSTGGSGYNVVKGGPGLYADGDVVLNAGSSSGTKDRNYLCEDLDLNAHDGGVLYAHYDYWWDNTIPTPVTSGGGVVYAANSRGLSNSTCTTTTSALARVEQATPEVGTLSVASLADAFATAPSDAEEALFAAKALVAEQRYDEAVGLFEQILTEHPLDRAAHAALLEVRLLHKRTGHAGARSILASLASTSGPHRASALGALVALDARAGRDADALARVEALAALYPDAYQAFDARLTAFHVHLSRKRYPAALATLDGIQARTEKEQRALVLAYWAYAIESGQEVSPGFTQEAAWPQPSAEAVVREVVDGATRAVAVTTYPNPFNPVTTIEYRLPVAGHVVLKVYDVLGREVQTLIDGEQSAGVHRARFEASHLPSGTYLYRLEASGQVVANALHLLK